MKTLFILLFSALALAAAEPEIKPTAPPVPVLSDKQRGDYWFAQYKASQNELAIAKAKLAAVEKLMNASAESGRDAAGQAVIQSCPMAKLDDSGDIVCPKPAPEPTPEKPGK